MIFFFYLIVIDDDRCDSNEGDYLLLREDQWCGDYNTRGIKQLMIELVVSMDSGRIVQWPNSEGMQLPAHLKSDAEIDMNGSEND
jgi:hypothetical protein